MLAAVALGVCPALTRAQKYSGSRVGARGGVPHGNAPRRNTKTDAEHARDVGSAGIAVLNFLAYAFPLSESTVATTQMETLCPAFLFIVPLSLKVIKTV